MHRELVKIYNHIATIALTGDAWTASDLTDEEPTYILVDPRSSLAVRWEGKIGHRPSLQMRLNGDSRKS
jgi:hypothetical protein